MKIIEKTFYRIYNCHNELVFTSEDLDEAQVELAGLHEDEEFHNLEPSRLETEIEEIEVEDEGRDPDDAYDFWREQREFN